MNNHPDSSKLLFLIGMPAVGKTFWGREIAEEYGIRFIDLDEYIEELCGLTISKLFADHGADIFRELEHEHLKMVLDTADEPTIISCGGGTPCYYNNIQIMKNAGTVIYLRAEVPYLLNNLEKCQGEHPVFENIEDFETAIAALLKKRRHFYEEAHHILQANNISITTFAEIISSCINRP